MTVFDEIKEEIQKIKKRKQYLIAKTNVIDSQLKEIEQLEKDLVLILVESMK